MPQKKNPDALELIRSRSAVVSAASQQVKMIIRSLPSGYNRDFQDTKEPLFKGTKATVLAVRVMTLTVQKLTVNKEALLKGFSSEIFATDELFKRLAEGTPFRELYLEVGKNLAKVEALDPMATIKSRSSLGTAGNLNLPEKIGEAQNLTVKTESALKEILEVYKKLSPAAERLVKWSSESP